MSYEKLNSEELLAKFVNAMGRMASLTGCIARFNECDELAKECIKRMDGSPSTKDFTSNNNVDEVNRINFPNGQYIIFYRDNWNHPFSILYEKDGSVKSIGH